MNAPGAGGVRLADRFAAAWAHVAAAFRRTSVLGYELFNEPWPGTAWAPCAATPGCPAFDVKLKAFYERVFARVRTVDRRQLIWYEPNVLFNGGANTNLGPYLEEMVARADRFMVPWLEWAYCGCSDPTTSGPGTKQAIVIDPRRPPSGSNLELATLRALVEPYPQVVAGTPAAWSFTRASRRFRVSFSTTRVGRRSRFPGGSVSEIATPAFVYGGRYGVAVSGGVPVSARGASTLRIASCRGASRITVTVSPGSARHGSCPAPKRR